MLLSLPRFLLFGAALVLPDIATASSFDDLRAKVDIQSKHIENQTKLIDAQAERLGAMESVLQELHSNLNGVPASIRGGGNKRLLKAGKSKHGKDRNICYSTWDEPGPIIALAACGGGEIPFPTGGCFGDRRKLSHEEARERLDEWKHHRRDFETFIGDDGFIGDDDFGFNITNFESDEIGEIGYYNVGAIEIKKEESLMIELTTTTISLLADAYLLVADLMGSYAIAGFAVTARMWPVCDNPDCAEEGEPIIAQPMEWLPIAVHAEGQLRGGLTDDIFGELGVSLHAQTTTSKLFFPASDLVEGTYFVTLDFAVIAAAGFFTTGGAGFEGALAGAVLGPHIIDAQIIHDGDFGNCNWLLESDTEGCGLFSTDPECDP